jgi:hypothetical protein
MNRKNTIALGAAVLSLVTVAAALTVIDFNGLPVTGAPLPIPNGYAGMNWSGLDYVTRLSTSGIQNIAVPTFGSTAQTMTAANPGQPFRLFGLAATGEYNTTLTIYAYDNGKFLGSQTFHLAPVFTPMPVPDWGNATQLTFIGRDANQRPAVFNLYNLTLD